MSWVAVAVVVLVWYREIVLYELGTKGLWASSNGRLLSFCDSLYSMFRFRGLEPKAVSRPPSRSASRSPSRDSSPAPPKGENGVGGAPAAPQKNYYYLFSPKNTLRDKLSLLVSATMVKYFSATLVSLLLWERPTWLKGWRHIGSFFLSVYLIQASPGDVVYKWMQRHFVVQVLLYGSCAVYKMRKIVFVLNHPAIADSNWPLKVVVALINLEGGSLSRRLETWRTGVGLSAMFSDVLDPGLFQENLKWAQRQFWPGVTAIILTGAGQKCWFCPHTSWSDYAGQGWTPIPVKFAEDTSVGVLTYADWLWAHASEYYFHPIALCLHVYRFLRQLSWSDNLPEIDTVGTTLAALATGIILLATVSLAQHRTLYGEEL